MAEDRVQEEDDGFIAPPSQPIKVGHRVQENTEEKPDTLSARLQLKAKTLADRLFERRAALNDHAKESYKSTKLSPEEKKQQYKDMISSNTLLMSALAGAAIIGKDGRLRISNKMVSAFKNLADKRSK